MKINVINIVARAFSFAQRYFARQPVRNSHSTGAITTRISMPSATACPSAGRSEPMPRQRHLGTIATNFNADGNLGHASAGEFGNCASTVANSGTNFIGNRIHHDPGQLHQSRPGHSPNGASFGDPGAAFVLNITNTLGMTNFQLQPRPSDVERTVAFDRLDRGLWDWRRTRPRSHR